MFLLLRRTYSQGKVVVSSQGKIVVKKVMEMMKA
jgi:hypothetical protein